MNNIIIILLLLLYYNYHTIKISSLLYNIKNIDINTIHDIIIYDINYIQNVNNYII